MSYGRCDSEEHKEWPPEEYEDEEYEEYEE
jgi:hypothetical protein